MPFRCQDVLSIMEDLASKPVTRFGEEWPVVYGRHRRNGLVQNMKHFETPLEYIGIYWNTLEYIGI